MAKKTSPSAGIAAMSAPGADVFRELINSVHDYLIILLNPDGTVASWSPAAERIMGYKPDEIIGKHCSCFHQPEEPQANPTTLRYLEVAKDKGRSEDEGWRVRKDGSRFWANVIVTALRAPDGTLQGFAKIARDLTERRAAEEEIRQQLRLTQALEERVARRSEELEKERSLLEARVKQRTEELEIANKELESFAYSVSHDLRAPLRHVEGWSLALLEDCGDMLDDRGRMFLERVRWEVLRMGTLINDLLELSRVSRHEMRRTHVDLAAIARPVVHRLREDDPERDVDIIIEENLPADGDLQLLEIVLTNLLGNAWKFTAKRPKACIELGRIVDNGDSAFYVRDNGVGFDMDQATDLARPFHRLHAEAEFPGSGIGLAIVQRIVQRHGGRLWATAEPDKGATLFFTLATQALSDRTTTD